MPNPEGYVIQDFSLKSTAILLISMLFAAIKALLCGISRKSRS